MDATNLVTLAVAIIAAMSAFASQRSSAKAAKQTKTELARVNLENSRVGMEKDAYDRARAFDTETIARQNMRIAELSREVKALRFQVRLLESRQTEVEVQVDEDRGDHHER